MKVICAGLQKTGTKTISEALRILGFNVHDVFEQFMLDKELWYKVLDNTVTEEDYKKYLSDVDAVADLPGNIYWEQLLEVFPDAKVILTERSSEDEWYRSVKNHLKVQTGLIPMKSALLATAMLRILSPLRYEMMKFASAFIQASLGISQMWGNHAETILRSRYRQYNTYVKSTCPRDKLLVYNVKEGWQPLCEFLGVAVPGEPFPTENVKGAILRELRERKFKYDCGYVEMATRQMKQRIIILLAVVTVLLVFLAF